MGSGRRGVVYVRGAAGNSLWNERAYGRARQQA